MKLTHSNALDLEAIERDARQLRAAFVADMIASVRTWVVSKFSTSDLADTKAA